MVVKKRARTDSSRFSSIAAVTYLQQHSASGKNIHSQALQGEKVFEKPPWSLLYI